MDLDSWLRPTEKSTAIPWHLVLIFRMPRLAFSSPLRTWPRSDPRWLWGHYFVYFWALRTLPMARVSVLEDLSIPSWKETCRYKLSSFSQLKQGIFVCLDPILYFYLILNYFPQLWDTPTWLTVINTTLRFQCINQRREEKECERILIHSRYMLHGGIYMLERWLNYIMNFGDSLSLLNFQ